jgi:hypothetical protein
MIFRGAIVALAFCLAIATGACDTAGEKPNRNAANDRSAGSDPTGPFGLNQPISKDATPAPGQVNPPGAVPAINRPATASGAVAGVSGPGPFPAARPLEGNTDGPPAIDRSLQPRADGVTPTADKVRTSIDATLAAGKSLTHYDPFMRKVVRRLNIGEGDVVADIGPGTGLFEIAALEEKLPFATWYAVEVNQQALDAMTYALKKTALPGYERIKPVHSSMEDVMLPEGVLDAAVLINTPIFFDNEYRAAHGFSIDDIGAGAKCMASLKRAMKPCAKLHIIQVPHLNDKPVTEADILRSLGKQGFKNRSVEIFTSDTERFHAIFTPDTCTE